MSILNKDKYYALTEQSFYKKLGKVTKIVGLTIESIGPDAKLNDLCKIYSADKSQVLYAEVVGFKDSRVLLMPFDVVDGIGPGSIVENTESPLAVKVGDDILGHTLDGLGNPTDGAELTLDNSYSVEAAPPDPMEREIISEVLPLGVKAVDGLLTVGKGQRIGIFAGSGVGKSTLLGMFARNTKADINVIALIGERGREVREFVERDLGPEGMKRSVLVVATSDKPALIRNKAADNAEYQKQSSVFQTIMNNSQVVASEESIQAAYDEAMTYYETMATNSGMELETLVGYYGMDLDTFKAQVRMQAEENAKQQLVINAIADKEGIKVTDEELESMAEEYGFESVDKMKESAGENVVNESLLTNLVLKFVSDNAVAE